jgi:hypothetical protein
LHTTDANIGLFYDFIAWKPSGNGEEFAVFHLNSLARNFLPMDEKWLRRFKL